MESSTVGGTAFLVLPTFNEAENIVGIVEAARASLPGGSRILIVDDNSPDGTGEIGDRLASQTSSVEVLHRAGKEGLGPAYIAGFRHAMAAGADFLLQMDSDFSHDPADLPRLLAAAQNADLVIGSRYVAGGGVTDWGLLRRTISRGGSLYAQAMLGLRVRDLTGGFKCYRRATLEGIDLDAVSAKGYGFQIEMTYRAVKNGATVREVPILFRDRQAGDSKMSGTIVVEAAWQVPRLRLRGVR